MQEVPANVIEILLFRGRVDRQGKVLAALRRAVITQMLARRQILAAHFGPWQEQSSVNLGCPEEFVV